RWRGAFAVTKVGRYRYTLQARINRFTSWRQDLAKRIEAGQDIAGDLLIGARLIGGASERAEGGGGRQQEERANVLRLMRESSLSPHLQIALAEELDPLVAKYPDPQFTASYDKEPLVMVEREKARFSSWYEMFPRSYTPTPGRHGTFKVYEACL